MTNSSCGLARRRGLCGATVVALGGTVGCPSSLTLSISAIIPPMRSVLARRSIDTVRSCTVTGGPATLRTTFRLGTDGVGCLVAGKGLLPALSIRTKVDADCFRGLGSRGTPITFGGRFGGGHKRCVCFDFDFPFFSNLSQVAGVHHTHGGIQVTCRGRARALHRLRGSMRRTILSQRNCTGRAVRVRGGMGTSTLTCRVALHGFRRKLVDPLSIRAGTAVLLGSGTSLLREHLLCVVGYHRISCCGKRPLVKGWGSEVGGWGGVRS